MSKFLVNFATTSSHYIGFTKQQKRAKKKEQQLKKKEKQERRERRETRPAANRDVRAQRAANAELQNEDSVLEEGDLLRLETFRHQPTADVAESESRDCVVKPWGLQWVMMHDQA
jgi:paraquat-inducible protein B